MITKMNTDYLTNWAWFQDIVGGKNIILRRTSALEYMQLFVGYIEELKIDVYAKEKGEYDNINYYIVDSFDDIDYFCDNNVMCATASYTFNEMMSDYDNIDGIAFIEGLAEYYFSHNESFDELIIEPQNKELFDEVKDEAIKFYSWR